jgi:hypothetical protein
VEAEATNAEFPAFPIIGGIVGAVSLSVGPGVTHPGGKGASSKIHQGCKTFADRFITRLAYPVWQLHESRHANGEFGAKETELALFWSIGSAKPISSTSSTPMHGLPTPRVVQGLQPLADLPVLRPHDERRSAVTHPGLLLKQGEQDVFLPE